MTPSPSGLASSYALTTCSRVVRFVATPRPWLPYCGLTTTGTPISWAASQASSASSRGGRPARARRRFAAAAESAPCPGRSTRRWRWCGRSRRSRSAAAASRSRAARGFAVEPADGNAAALGGLDDRPRARAEAHVVGQRPQLGQLERQCRSPGRSARPAGSRGRPASRRVPSSSCSNSTITRYRPAVFVDGPRPAKADVAAAQRLQLERDVLQDVGRIGAAVEPLEEAAPLADAAAMLDHRGEPALEPLVKAGESRWSTSRSKGPDRPRLPAPESWPRCSAREASESCEIPWM